MMERTDEITDEVAAERRDAFNRAHAEAFEVADGRGGIEVQLHQVADEHFALQHPIAFRRTRADGSVEVVRINGSDHAHNMSDLTSVPPSLTWFVPKYGRHTSAALIHDALLDVAAAEYAKDARSALAAYEDADDVFRAALEALDVPLIRRTTMWGAVCFGTRLRTTGWPRMLVRLWLVAFALGTWLLVSSFANGRIGGVALALALPLPASALWGRQWRAGLVASATAVFIAVPTLAGFVTYALYEVVEFLVGLLPGVERPDGPRPYTGFDFVPQIMQKS